jgi:predicted AlkP superfamily phosphohydrolase/phosphomutase
MKKKLLALLLLAACASAAPKPKLVVLIVFDQFRYDYLTRFRSEYKGGFARLLTRGANFSNAYYDHFPTVTAPGHATMMSGATPSISGIIGNDWYERQANRSVNAVSDPTVELLGLSPSDPKEAVTNPPAIPGTSPRRMLVSTVGDELKRVSPKSKVIGISFKDRGAVFTAGHMADAAYWYHEPSGKWISSTYYFPKLPDWVQSYNDSRPLDRYMGAMWLDKELPHNERGTATGLPASPFGNQHLEEFAERIITNEKLGQRGVTDILTVSFSAHDKAGHITGPDSPEVKEISIQTDRQLEQFFRFLDAKVGLINTLVVMTSDHGVAAMPELNKERVPGGRVVANTVRDVVLKALIDKFGAGRWILNTYDHSLYLNTELMAAKSLDRAEVNKFVAQVVQAIPHVARAYTREQLMSGMISNDQIGRRVQNGFFAPRAADVYLLMEPNWIFSSKDAAHGSVYSHDAHVPLILMGQGIKPGNYRQSVIVNDIAPTLASILEIETPSGSIGRALAEAILP